MCGVSNDAPQTAKKPTLGSVPLVLDMISVKSSRLENGKIPRGENDLYSIDLPLCSELDHVPRG